MPARDRRRWRYSRTHTQPQRQKGLGGERDAPAALLLGKRSGTYFTGGWVDLGAGLEGYGKAHTTGVRTLDHPAGNQLLYRLRHPGCHFRRNTFKYRCLECCVI